MRSRARLIEVLESVNGPVKGLTEEQALFLHTYVSGSLHGYFKQMRHSILPRLENMSRNMRSPHIRELATEALFYLRQDNV